MDEFQSLAVKVLAERGLELLSPEPEGGYFYVKNTEGRPFPLLETRLAAWVIDAKKTEEERKEDRDSFKEELRKAADKFEEAK